MGIKLYNIDPGLKSGSFPAFPAKIPQGQRIAPQGKGIGVIGDAHGSATWVKWMQKLLGVADIVVSLGDYFDRGQNNCQVFNLAHNESMDGRLIPCMGNHDLTFLLAMAGDSRSYSTWTLPNNGGKTVLAEMGISPIIPVDVYAQVTSNRALKEIESWMIRGKNSSGLDGLRLLYQDQYGGLYLHAGIPLDATGKVRLEYGSQTGLPALYLAENEMKGALERRDIRHRVFSFLQEGPYAFLWQRSWIDIARSYGAQHVLEQLPGVNRIFFGHTPQHEILNINDLILGVDREAVLGQGGYAINRPDGGVGLHSVGGGEREIAAPAQPFYLRFIDLDEEGDVLLSRLGDKTSSSNPPQCKEDEIRLEPRKPKTFKTSNVPILVILAPGLEGEVTYQIVRNSSMKKEIRKRFGIDPNGFSVVRINGEGIYALFDGSTIVLGLENDNLLKSNVIDDYHVSIGLREGQIVIEDLGSRKGTRINLS